MTALVLLLAVVVLKCVSGETELTWKKLATLPLADAKMIAGYDSTTNRIVIVGGGDDTTRRFSVKLIDNAEGDEKVDWENDIDIEKEILLRTNGQSVTSMGNKVYFIGSADGRLHHFIPYSNKRIHIETIEFEGYMFYILHYFIIITHPKKNIEINRHIQRHKR